MNSYTTALSINTLKDEAKARLAMTGRRLPSKDGNTLYTSSTLTGAEEAYLTAYIKEGVSVFLGGFAPLVTGYEESGSVRVVFHSIRIDDAKADVFKNCFTGFVVAYTELKVFGLSLNEAARKDEEEAMQGLMAAAVKLLFTPDPPSSSGKTLADMHGEVILD